MEPTQGPYTVEHDAKGRIIVTGNNGYEYVSEVFNFSPNAEANAALLAASWEMWEGIKHKDAALVQIRRMLREIIDACTPPGVPNVQWITETAQAALALAKNDIP